MESDQQSGFVFHSFVFHSFLIETIRKFTFVGDGAIVGSELDHGVEDGSIVGDVYLVLKSWFRCNLHQTLKRALFPTLVCRAD